MTDTEMLQYCKDNFPFAVTTESGWNDIKMVFKEGYEQGQKDFDKDIEKLLNSYEIKYIDCNSIGGLIAFHQLYLELKKENAELKARISDYEKLEKFLDETLKEKLAQIEKMKRPQNCKHSGSDYCMTNGYCVCDKWELAE